LAGSGPNELKRQGLEAIFESLNQLDNEGTSEREELGNTDKIDRQIEWIRKNIRIENIKNININNIVWARALA